MVWRPQQTTLQHTCRLVVKCLPRYHTTLHTSESSPCLRLHADVGSLAEPLQGRVYATTQQYSSSSSRARVGGRTRDSDKPQTNLMLFSRNASESAERLSVVTSSPTYISYEVHTFNFQSQITRQQYIHMHTQQYRYVDHRICWPLFARSKYFSPFCVVAVCRV